MDYTKFLGKKDYVVLAYLGGAHVFGKDRRLRVRAPRPSVGFHRFEIDKGRAALALEAVDAPHELLEGSRLPRVRGHHLRGFVTVSARGRDRTLSQDVERVYLTPEDEPPPLAILRARRWHSGDLVFESLDFDTEVEERARVHLSKLEPLGDLKGVSSSLRVAYSAALVSLVAERMGVPMSVREALGAGPSVASGGEGSAVAFVSAVEVRRRAAGERLEAHVSRGRASLSSLARRRLREEPSADNAPLRAELALDVADARLLTTRPLAGGTLEVTFELLGERFISVIDAITLQVYDSGVCLAGADELVTLESLPGVIREAIDTGQLVITRR